MSVYVIYRSAALAAGKFVCRFGERGMMDWFRAIWNPIEGEAEAKEYASRLFGRPLLEFACLFNEIAEKGLLPPRNVLELVKYLGSVMEIADSREGAHYLELLTCDGEGNDAAFHIFDDEHAAEYPARVSYLMYDSWQLPDGDRTAGFSPHDQVPELFPRGEWTGSTYVVAAAEPGQGTLHELANNPRCLRLRGVRLRELPRYLFSVHPNGEFPALIRSMHRDLWNVLDNQLSCGEETPLEDVARAPLDDAKWSAYAEYIEAREQTLGWQYLLDRLLRVTAVNLPNLDGINDEAGRVLVQGHIAQTSFYDPELCPDDRVADQYHNWILFDDLWAGANPDMANSILRFASRWDVL